jgi:hypothetical protein
MKSSFLKKIVLAFLVLFGAVGFTAHAQVSSEHFIYIQAKDKQPFYVILNNAVYSSSSIGYLVIPKLQSGSYDFKIGFPKQMESEREYTCVINDEDLGFSLQKKEDGSWGLLDLQSKTFLTVTTSATNAATTITQNSQPAEIPATTTTVQNNTAPIDTTPATQSFPSFGDMLSNVANDSTLNEPVATQQTKAAAATQTANNNVAATPEPVNNNVAANNAQSNINSSVEETYGIIKIGENLTNDGQQMTFVLFNSRTTDTVQILIPEQTPPPPPAAPPVTTVVQSNPEPKNTLPLFSDDNSTPVNNAAPVNADAQSVLAQCDNPLTDKEMLKLQKKIISKRTDDEMLSLVDKTVKGKCVTTEQVRQLGASFTSDAGRFALYQDVYGNVADKGNYASLQNQLLDGYFKKRFTDMLNQ